MNFENAQVEEEPMDYSPVASGPVGGADGLRDALTIIDAAVKAWQSEPTPVAAATNALIQTIAVREERSIGEVANELRALAARPVSSEENTDAA